MQYDYAVAVSYFSKSLPLLWMWSAVLDVKCADKTFHLIKVFIIIDSPYCMSINYGFEFMYVAITCSYVCVC